MKTTVELCQMAHREPEMIAQNETVSDLAEDALEAHRIKREWREYKAKYATRGAMDSMWVGVANAIIEGPE